LSKHYNIIFSRYAFELTYDALYARMKVFSNRRFKRKGMIMKRNFHTVAFLGTLIVLNASTSVVNAGFWDCRWFFSGLSEQASQKSAALIGYVCALPQKAWYNFGVIFKKDLREAERVANERTTNDVNSFRTRVDEQLQVQGSVLNGLQGQARNLAELVGNISTNNKENHDRTMMQMNGLEDQRQLFEREMTQKLTTETEALKKQLQEHKEYLEVEIRKIDDQRRKLEQTLENHHASLATEIRLSNEKELEALEQLQQEQQRRNQGIHEMLEKLYQGVSDSEGAQKEIKQRIAQAQALVKELEQKREEQVAQQAEQLVALRCAVDNLGTRVSTLDRTVCRALGNAEDLGRNVHEIIAAIAQLSDYQREPRRLEATSMISELRIPFIRPSCSLRGASGLPTSFSSSSQLKLGWK
jgi:hypothetical protein